MRSVVLNILSALIFTFLINEVRSDLFNETDHRYLRNVQNITSIGDLEEFFDTQTCIFVDNVYTQYQRFFYRLLGVLPKSPRRDLVKEMCKELEKFLELVDLDKKLLNYEKFLEKNSQRFDQIFEYDADETLIGAKEFHQIFVDNEADQLLTHVNDEQMYEFVDAVGIGIKWFLLQIREHLIDPQIMLVKFIVNEFVENPEFTAKLSCLRVLIEQFREFLASTKNSQKTSFSKY